MTKFKWGALALSLASVCAIAATSAGAYYGAFADSGDPVTEIGQTVEATENKTKYDQIEVAALEQYYTERIASPEMMSAVTGLTVQDGWKGQTINPDFDDVTISYDYTKLSYNETISNIPYGFRIVLGDKCMVIARWTSRVVMMRIDGSDGTLNVKADVDDFYKQAPNTTDSQANYLGKTHVNGVNTSEVYVNTGEYYNLPKAVSGLDDGSNILSGGLPTVHNSATTSNPKWSVSLRKITDENGAVTFRYYEDGNYIFTLQFEDEVTGYAPNSYNYDNGYDRYDNFNVTLGDKYTEYDAAQDSLTGSHGARLNVGEEFDVSFIQRYKSSAGWYELTFTDGDSVSGAGITLLRFMTRIALSAKREVHNRAGAAAQNIYIDAKASGGIYTNGAAVYTAKSAADSDNLANNYGVTDMKACGYRASYRIVRLEDKIIETQRYQVFSLYETQLAPTAQAERYIADIGMPVENEQSVITVGAITNSAGFTSGINAMTTSANRALLEAKAPAATTADFTDSYAETLEGASVRFSLGSTGLRFCATANEELIAAMQGYYGAENVTFGVKLVRGDGAFAYIEAKNYTLANGVYTFNGVVSNIKAEHYDTNYTPYVYVRYTDKQGEVKVIETQAGEAKNIKAVAQAILADVTAAADATHIYAVSVDGTTTVYSPYTQAQIDIAKGFAA